MVGALESEAGHVDQQDGVGAAVADVAAGGQLGLLLGGQALAAVRADQQPRGAPARRRAGRGRRRAPGSRCSDVSIQTPAPTIASDERPDERSADAAPGDDGPAPARGLRPGLAGRRRGRGWRRAAVAAAVGGGGGGGGRPARGGDGGGGGGRIGGGGRRPVDRVAADHLRRFAARIRPPGSRPRSAAGCRSQYECTASGRVCLPQPAQVPGSSA